RAMNMAPFIFWNLAFYTIIRTQLKTFRKESTHLGASSNYQCGKSMQEHKAVKVPEPGEYRRKNISFKQL
ncbi:hypothetical protein ABNE94_19955, partial [Paenibacillus larvae]